MHRTCPMFASRLMFQTRLMFWARLIFGNRWMFWVRLEFGTWLMFVNRCMFQIMIMLGTRLTLNSQFKSGTREISGTQLNVRNSNWLYSKRGARGYLLSFDLLLTTSSWYYDGQLAALRRQPWRSTSLIQFHWLCPMRMDFVLLLSLRGRRASLFSGPVSIQKRLWQMV